MKKIKAFRYINCCQNQVSFSGFCGTDPNFGCLTFSEMIKCLFAPFDRGTITQKKNKSVLMLALYLIKYENNYLTIQDKNIFNNQRVKLHACTYFKQCVCSRYNINAYPFFFSHKRAFFAVVPKLHLNC